MKGSSLWLGLPVRFSKRAKFQVMASSRLPPSGAVQLASSPFTDGLYSRQSLFLFAHLFTNQHLLSISFMSDT